MGKIYKDTALQVKIQLCEIEMPHKWREKEQSVAINFTAASRRLFLRTSFYFLYLFRRIRAIYSRNERRLSRILAMSRIYTNREDYFCTRPAQSTASTWPPRTRAILRARARRSRRTGSPTHPSSPRVQESCARGCFCPPVNIFEIGRRPMAARSFGKIVMRRFA